MQNEYNRETSNSEQYKVATILKAALRTHGIDVRCEINGVGATIKENINGLYAITGHSMVEDKIPNEIRILGNITTKLIVNPESPFELIEEDGHYVRKKGEDEPILKVGFTRRPQHYSKETSSGMPMKSIGQAMGSDCIAIAVLRDCDYFKNDDFCKFCNIHYTHVKSGIPRLMNLDDIEEVVTETQGRFRFYGLTGGTFTDTDEEARTYASFGNIIKKVLNKKFGGPFSFTPPSDLGLLEKVCETGVDVMSFNREIWDQKAWEEICPGKAKIGTRWYDAAFEEARKLWGTGNAVVQFIAGPWESNESLLEGARYHADRGILTNITLFEGAPGSRFQKREAKTLREIIELYVELGEIYRQHPEFLGRRSVLTSPSANRSSISNEVAFRYLTKDNFDPDKDLFGIGDHKWIKQPKTPKTNSI